MKKINGLTLLEFLVVIAIIAIMGGILYPVFAKAREKARLAELIKGGKISLISLKDLPDLVGTIEAGDATLSIRIIRIKTKPKKGVVIPKEIAIEGFADYHVDNDAKKGYLTISGVNLFFDIQHFTLNETGTDWTISKGGIDSHYRFRFP